MTGLDQEKLDQYLPDGPITSLRRIQTLYGALAEASSGDLIGGDPEFGLYYTPGELDGFSTSDPGEEKRYLITVEVDLTAETVTAQDVNVDVDFLELETVGKLGFARYPWGRGIDHSITRRGAKGGSDADTVATYCIDCLERWTNADGREPAIGEVAETHPDGWVIQLLQELGQDETVQERIKNQTEERYMDDERVVATVTLRLDPDDLEERPNGDRGGWFYPGEIGVLNAGMKARKDDKLASKQVSTPSRGESACMVTGERSEVFGTAEDPLAFFTLQHAEKFDGVQREQAWRSHPVSSNAALLIQSGSSLIDACRTTRNGLGVYTLPYFVEVDERDAEELYSALDQLQEFDGDTQHPMFFLEKTIGEEAGREKVEALRFYVISLRNDSGDINVIHEVPDVSLYWPRKIATAHRTVLHESSAFGPLGFEYVDNWQPITPRTWDDDVVNSIVSGRYAWGTMPVMAGDDGAMADDLAEWLTYALLTGEEIPVERLLDGYVERIEQEYRDDEEDRLPTNHIKTQFAQLEALARAGLLTGESASANLTTPPKTMTKDVPAKAKIAGDGDLTRIDVRRYRLETFIEDRESLDENPDRESAFLIGVLVGMMSYHQTNTREMNRTVVDQYPPTQVTIDRLVRVWPELAEKSDVYAKDADWAGESLFPEVLDRQTEDFVHPGEWDLSLQDVRFFYALGITYGKRADLRAYDLQEQIEAEDVDSSEPETADVA
ncbi:type I-B CRISPR-associated protein Cas8b/Csh1 [Halobellus captivus]|uniref:type I-B CRISPR-associated protein Cas8b/Csh1 n=1 Tax=Halobellus captivus TaxID=2592614 RepID=UPI0011A9D7E3|nr:type I-B CRISPR-associated protein Cas8b/Csh1 [Halobellus captivus]